MRSSRQGEEEEGEEEEEKEEHEQEEEVLDNRFIELSRSEDSLIQDGGSHQTHNVIGVV